MPCLDLGVHVPRLRHHRRAAEQLTPGIDHAPVEVLQHRAHVALPPQGVEPGVELAVLDAQHERGRAETGEVLPLDLAADPPVRIVMIAMDGSDALRLASILGVEKVMKCLGPAAAEAPSEA